MCLFVQTLVIEQSNLVAKHGLIPPQGVFASKASPTKCAAVVSLLHVHALMVSLQVCFPGKLFATLLHRTVERIFPLFIVCFQMSLVIVASREHFATAFDLATETSILRW